MRMIRFGLIAVVLGSVSVGPARGQAVEPPPESDPARKRTLPPIRIIAPKPNAEATTKGSPVVTEIPAFADFVVIPLRVHVLAATDLPEVSCGLADADITRVVAKVNGVWHKAGIHWAPDPIVREAAARQDRFRAARKDEAEDPLLALKVLAPDESRSEEGVDVYYIHHFAINGVYLGDRTAFVQEMAQLRPVEGGIDEPLPRVTAHELGHALGLPHRQDRTNLLASGTTGTTLNEAEVARARARALRIPGAASALDLRRRADEARGRGDAGEADRLGAILRGVPTDQGPGKPAPTVEPAGAGLR